MTRAALDLLHDQYPGCETLAFADLATQMVLISNTQSPLSREGLDALCAEAALVFGADNAPAIGDNPAGQVLVATARHLRIYLRTISEPHDALCCVCDHDIPVDAFMRDALSCLHRISYGE